METLLSGFVIQLILSALLFATLIYFVLKNARLKRQIEQAASPTENKEDK